MLGPFPSLKTSQSVASANKLFVASFFCPKLKKSFIIIHVYTFFNCYALIGIHKETVYTKVYKK